MKVWLVLDQQTATVLEIHPDGDDEPPYSNDDNIIQISTDLDDYSLYELRQNPNIRDFT